MKTNSRVLFIGDSITDAFRRPEEVNDAFQLGNGYAFLIASRLKFLRPQDNLEFLNRGVSGNGLRDLEARWENDCLELRPTLISILVGVNETISYFRNNYSRLDPESFVQRYAALLERTQAALPDVRFVLCEPFLLPCGMVKPEWIEDIKPRQEALRELAQACKITFVPLQAPFNDALKRAPAEYWAYDGVHASAAGFQLIAREWLRAVENEPLD